MSSALTKRQRACAIAQLCVAFSMILWHLGYPFTGHYAAIESQRILYHVAMAPDGFQALTPESQAELQKGYQALQAASEKSFITKCLEAIERILWQLPPFEIAWILLGTLIPLFILLRWDGALNAAWLLPILVICYGIDGKMRGEEVILTQEERLFPTEGYLIQNYSQDSLSKSTLEQQQQLQKAWETYLIAEWAHEKPAVDQTLFRQQMLRGQQAFTIARVKTLSVPSTAPKLLQPSWWILAFYLCWNLFVVWGTRKTVNEKYS